MTRLLLLTASELTRDPRARRQAAAALDRGLEVVGLCGRVTGDEPWPIEGVRVIRIGGDRVSGPLRRAGLGGMKPSRPLARELRGVYRLLRLGRLTARLAFAARRAGRVDVVHANDFETLPAAWLIARRSGARLVYDSHELYTGLEPDPPRIYRAALGRVERALGRRADAVVTTGEPYARELERLLDLARPPLIVHNCPERRPEEPAEPPSAGRLQAIYQAAMGSGRRLEDVLTAAEHAPDVDLTLRVLGADYDELRSEIERRGLAGRVSLSDLVPPGHLIEGLAGHHAGLIINRPVSPTNELVVPNKLFEYMMAGLAVVAPRLPGLEPIVEGEGVGLCFDPGRPEQMGEALQRLSADRGLLDRYRNRARTLALERYNAEAQVVPLLAAWGVPASAVADAGV